MAMLDIYIYDDPILRQTARPVEKITERHRQLAHDMAETMYATNGIGLAANQVGLLERLIVVDVEWSERRGNKNPRNPIAMLNPEILEESDNDDMVSEGCLSLPEIEGNVWRPVHIRYRYMDLNGQTVEAEAEDMKARCIQHELDHLNGILFIDRMAAEERQKLAGKLARLRKAREAGKV